MTPMQKHWTNPNVYTVYRYHDKLVNIVFQLVDKLNTDESAADIQMDYEDVSSSE